MKTNGTKSNKPGKWYPEQSDRQALRGYRRAQGGLGISEGLNPTPRGGYKLAEENILDLQTNLESTVDPL